MTAAGWGKPYEGPTANSEHLATFWTMRGPFERDITCAAYSVETGLELRTSYGETEITRDVVVPRADDR